MPNLKSHYLKINYENFSGPLAGSGALDAAGERALHHALRRRGAQHLLAASGRHAALVAQCVIDNRLGRSSVANNKNATTSSTITTENKDESTTTTSQTSNDRAKVRFCFFFFFEKKIQKKKFL